MMGVEALIQNVNRARIGDLDLVCVSSARIATRMRDRLFEARGQILSECRAHRLFLKPRRQP